ncbi:MAG TPA: deoxyguanosinetriphosphate triphosphohydrolase [Gemmatales bacterium]|nr:deoxyguanosinetriphosphate triphosphohydrolase [Gemmatales bacterium]HMP59816.1 deoxyguanosinetriphosphate triphosphohydrolase [Gemmatales bacterium]
MSDPEAHLAPYAQRSSASRGRRHPEPTHRFRGCYQRDRDRIIHSAAFRRLMYKTQVLVHEYSDQHRTRLTHTLEVAQISRTIARQLGLNEDLTEAIALVHDVGHPPFGHAGESVLAECLRDHGGFEHNRFGLRLVEELEQRYPPFPGLNLTWEVRASLAYHSKEPNAPEVRAYLDPGCPQPFLEAQIVDAADSLAYDTHDLDDALTLGLIQLADLDGIALWQRGVERVRERYGTLAPAQLHPAAVRALIDLQVDDLLEHSQARLADLGIAAPGDACRLERPLIAPGPELERQKGELEAFLHAKVYRHPEVLRLAQAAQRRLRELFETLTARPDWVPGLADWPAPERPRAVGAYLASRTDRAAQDDHLRLCQSPT